MLTKLTNHPIYQDTDTGRFVVFLKCDRNYFAAYFALMSSAELFAGRERIGKPLTSVQFWDAALGYTAKKKPAKRVRRHALCAAAD